MSPPPHLLSGRAKWGTTSKHQCAEEGSAAAGPSNGEAVAGASVQTSRKSINQPWLQGYTALPRLSAIRTTRATSETVEVKETPRLRVDRLKGNVFVNQYLVIKDLGKGAHGTVKLVLDTEDQIVYAMKVIHRKQHRRRNSYSFGPAGSICTGTPSSAASGGSPYAAAYGSLGSLVRAHSMSAEPSALAGHTVGKSSSSFRSSTMSPFTAPGSMGPTIQQQAFGSGSSTFNKSGNGSSCKQRRQLPQQHFTMQEVPLLSAVASPGAAQQSTDNDSKQQQQVQQGAEATAPFEQLQCGLQILRTAAAECEQAMDAAPTLAACLPVADGVCGATTCLVTASSDSHVKVKSARSQSSLTFSTPVGLLSNNTAAAIVCPSGPAEEHGTQGTVAPVVCPAAAVFADAPAVEQPAAPPMVLQQQAAAADTATTVAETDTAADTVAAVVPRSPQSWLAASPLNSQLRLTCSSSMSRASSAATAGCGTWGTPIAADDAAGVAATGSSYSDHPSAVPVATAAADSQTADLMREMAVMKNLSHPNVVALHEVIHDPDARLLIMVMEFMPGGPLLCSAGQSMTEPLPETAARRYFRELVSGLDYLHYNLIMHGDLKPDNLLLSAEGNLKISDFGSAAVLPSADALISTTLGTPAFMAPEMCGLKSSPFKPFPAECWALGVCLFMFVYGRVPYAAPSTGMLYERIREATPVQLPERPAVSGPLSQLLRGLLDKVPETRMTLADVCAHAWVTGGGKLQPVRRCCEEEGTGTFSPVGAALSTAEQSNAITGLKQQVKAAIPSVEERTYRKGQILVAQGKVPDGLFLILQGTCELVLGEIIADHGNSGDGGTGVNSGIGNTGVVLPTVPRKESDMDFAAQLSSSSSDGNDDDEQEQEGNETEVGLAYGSYSPLAQSMNFNRSWSPVGLLGATPTTAVGLPDDEEQQQQQHQQHQQHAELAAPEQSLPSLLPPPRWQHQLLPDNSLSPQQIQADLLPVSSWNPASNCTGNRDISSGGTEPATQRCSSNTTPRQAAAYSAGPVMFETAVEQEETAESAHAAAAAHSCHAFSADGSTSGAGGSPKHRGHSQSVDFTAFSAVGSAHAGQLRRQVSGVGSDMAGYGLGRPQPTQMPHGAPAGWPFGSRASTPPSPLTGLGLRYNSLTQASAPDLHQLLMASAGRPESPCNFGGTPGSAGTAGLLVQRSASSATMGRAFNRAMRRSESMHKRMKQLVVQAKLLTEHNSKRQELVGVRGPGQVVGDTSFGSRALPASTTVRARTRMKVLLVRRADAAALKHQPVIKAALYRTQTESSVLDVLESFATYDNEVTAIDDLRMSLAAASSSFSAAAQLSALAAAASGLSFSQHSGLAVPAVGPMPVSHSSKNLEVLGEEGQTTDGLAAKQSSSPSFSAAVSQHSMGGSLNNTGLTNTPLGYNAGSFSALGGLRPASRTNSFTATAVAQLQTASLTQQQQVYGSGMIGGSSVQPGISGCVSPMGGGDYANPLFAMGRPASCSPSRGSSSRFALSAAASERSSTLSREISPMPSGTAAALAAAARDAGIGSKQVSQRSFAKQVQFQVQQAQQQALAPLQQ